MNDLAMARGLLAGLAERLGLEGLLADDEDMAVLDFEEGPPIQLTVDEEGGIALMVHLGDAPEGDVELAEELLASNLNWRDTDGATLSMERYTRGVFLARRWTVAELGSVQGLSTALERFMLLADRWVQVFPQLVASGRTDTELELSPRNFTGVRG
jgi:hypothetical protein